MKTKKFTMAAKLLFLVAIGICVLSFGNAYAQNASATALLYTYYDVRAAKDGGLDLTDNYFTVTNTHTNWVQAHVRIRTGDKSVELMDFDILLSPRDVFSFDLYMAANGGIEFASCDTKTLQNSGFTTTSGCVVMNSATNPNMLSLIKTCQGYDDAKALAATQKGYVEVIGEGRIVQLASDKTKCASWDSTNTGRTIPGRTLYQLQNAAVTSNCAIDILDMPSALEGKQYFVTVKTSVTPFIVNRLAMLNAESLDNALPAWSIADTRQIILHADSFTAESTRCAGDVGCFAYVSASTTTPTNGAADLNQCFYTDATGTPATGVQNKFGAAATFGPTIADLGLRRAGTTGACVAPTGIICLTRDNLNDASLTLSNMSFLPAIDGLAGTLIFFASKANADSHYFAVPAPNIFDMASKFAFVFPIQHFINESDSIVASAWDMEENTTSVPTDKFISPGLPTVSKPGDEAALFAFNAPFPEGWARFNATAGNATLQNAYDPGAATRTTDTRVRCATVAPATCANVGYVPGFSGAAFVTGAEALSASLFSFGL